MVTARTRGAVVSMVGSCDGIKDNEGEMEDDGPVLVDGAMESVGAMDTVGAAEGELVGAE